MMAAKSSLLDNPVTPMRVSKHLVFTGIILFLISCSSTKNERRFLNALTGPNGEEISYYRAGSCCHFKTKNGMMGTGLLDNYRVTWEGAKDTISVYINMYDYGELKAPVGFGIRK